MTLSLTSPCQPQFGQLSYTTVGKKKYSGYPHSTHQLNIAATDDAFDQYQSVLKPEQAFVFDPKQPNSKGPSVKLGTVTLVFDLNAKQVDIITEKRLGEEGSPLPSIRDMNLIKNMVTILGVTNLGPKNESMLQQFVDILGQVQTLESTEQTGT